YQAGEIWADPNVPHAAELMRRVYENRSEAAAIGRAARAELETYFSEEAVGKLIAERLPHAHRDREFTKPQTDLHAGRATPKHVRYQQLVRRIRDLVPSVVPDG